MPRSVKLNEEMRAATQTAVLQSALKLFAQKGYAHTSTRAIAQEAGISIGLMYHYYDGKAALLNAVFNYCMETLSEAFTEAYWSSTPAQRLETILRTMFGLLTKDAPFWSLFYMLRTQPAIMAILGDSFRVWTERLRDIFVAELTHQGHSDPQLSAYLLYSLIEGTIQQYLLDPEQYPLVNVVDEIVAQYARSAARTE